MRDLGLEEYMWTTKEDQSLGVIDSLQMLMTRKDR